MIKSQLSNKNNKIEKGINKSKSVIILFNLINGKSNSTFFVYLFSWHYKLEPLFNIIMASTGCKMLTSQYIQDAIDHPEVRLFCKDLHHGITCEFKFLNQFISGCKSLSKMYLIVHLVPFLLFKRKKLKEKYFVD